MASPYQRSAIKSAKRYGLPTKIFLRLVNRESGWNPQAVSDAGAQGLTQLMPATAKSLGVTNPFDPHQSLDGGARYLRQQLDRFGTIKLALAAYNAGPGNVESGNWERIPETTRYVNGILGPQPATSISPSGGVERDAALPLNGTQVSSSPVSSFGFKGNAMQDAMLASLQKIAQGWKPTSALSFAMQNFSPLPSEVPPTPQLTPSAPQLTPSQEPSVTPPKRQSFHASGEPVPTGFLTSVGGEHPTMGLAGYPAHDYFAKAGAPVIAPVSGTIVRLSGHNPSDGPVSGVHGPFGWSLYLKGDDGRTYYLTHLGSRSVAVGQRVKAGAEIGTVGDYARYGGANHVHMGVH